MDDGRKYRKYWKYRKYRKYIKYTLMDDGWKYIKYLMRHFDETSWQDIFYETFLLDILTRHFDKTYWWPLMTCNDHWYGDDFNEMALDSFYCLLYWLSEHWQLVETRQVLHSLTHLLFVELLKLVITWVG